MSVRICFKIFLYLAFFFQIVVPKAMIKRIDGQPHAVRPDFRVIGKAHSDELHEVVFAIQQNNLEKLDEIFHEVSTPDSPKYGKFLTRQEVADLTANREGLDSVTAYLTEHKVAFKVTTYGDFVIAKAKVSVLEHIFDTTFYNFEHIEGHHQKLVRAREYSLDGAISHHIATVYDVVDMPFPSKPPVATKANDEIQRAFSDDPTIAKFDTSIYNGNTYPQFLFNYYNIKNSNKNLNQGTQCIYAAIKQYFSQNDLQQFQGVFGLPFHPVDTIVNGHMNDTQCVASVSSCTEANLDVQYILAVAPRTQTSYWYDSDTGTFAAWLTKVMGTSSPPYVISISYGLEEQFLGASEMTIWNNAAKALGVIGVTIVVASGDDGAPGYSARNGGNCHFGPTFPASSPYVTSVGATMGPERGQPEIACSSATGSAITTGGGFSKLAAASLAPWQKGAVENYKNTNSGKKAFQSIPYTPGRGYPDLSLLGNSYLIQVGTQAYGVSGTSASAPVFAGMVSLVNAGRLAAGKSALGFLNPALYTYNATIFRDITSGTNYNTAKSTVTCNQGFPTTVGWDPVTGLGSVDYVKFCTKFGGGDACSAAATSWVNILFVGFVTVIAVAVNSS